MASGAGSNFSTVLLPGLMAVAIMFSGIAAVALPDAALPELPPGDAEPLEHAPRNSSTPAAQTARRDAPAISGTDPSRRATSRKLRRLPAEVGQRAPALAEPVDVAVECSGAPVAIEAAIACTAWGGTTALVGIPRAGTRASFAVDDVLRNRRIVGSLNGSVDLQRDFTAIVEHVRHGDLEVDAQVSRVWPLRDIGEALAAVRAGSVVRAVLTHDA